MRDNLVRVMGWGVLWVLLFWISRANHPTSMLNVAATTVMVLFSVAAFTVITQTSRNAPVVLKLAGAASCIIGAGVLAALAVRTVYDIEIGPDPRRFGLVANIAMDTAVVAALVTLMGGLQWSLRRLGFKSQS